MEITKEGAQSLRMKMRNAELCLKETTVTYLRLVRTSVKVGKTRLLHLFNSEQRSKQAKLSKLSFTPTFNTALTLVRVPTVLLSSAW